MDIKEELTKAWMAGFMDGEGCITIARQIRKGRPSPAYRDAVSVSNTKKECFDVFIQRYGGTIYSVHEYRKDSRKVKWADAYHWRCPTSSTSRFINDILPYLRLKKEQAKIMLEFMATKNGFSRKKRNDGKHGGSAPLSGTEIRYREKLRRKIKLLNSKGQYARQQLNSSL